MRVAICTTRDDLQSMTGPGLATVRQAAAIKELGGEVILLAAAPSHVGVTRPFEIAGVQGVAVTGPVPLNRAWRDTAALATPRYLCEWYDLAVGRALRRELDRFQPQALLVHGMTPWGVAALRISAARAIPLAVVERSNVVARRMKSPAGLGKFYNTCARGCRAIFAADRLVRHRLGHDMGLENLVTLRDGGFVAPRELRQQMRPDRWFGRQLLLTTGFDSPAKGGDIQLEGFARANLPQATLVCLGGRTDRIRARAEELGIVDRVECLPEPGLEALERMLAWCDYFIMPGWSEGAGALTAEAMGAGAATIMAGDTPLAPDIDEGVNGWTFPAGDPAALAERLRNVFGTPNVAEVGEAGRELIRERFPWSRNAQRLLYEIGLLRTTNAGLSAAA